MNLSASPELQLLLVFQSYAIGRGAYNRIKNTDCRKARLGTSAQSCVLPSCVPALAAESPALLSGPEGGDADFRERLDASAQRNQQMLLLTAELLRLTRAIDQEGIGVLSFKGPAPAATLYGNVALRSAGDLDILVGPEDVQRTLKVLRESGLPGLPG